MSKLKVKVREEESQTNVYRNKRVIEVNHANKTISFWETKYTFQEIFDLCSEVPELAEMFAEAYQYDPDYDLDRED